MCNTLFVSTDSTEDLAALGLPNFTFSPADDSERIKLQGILAYPHKWYVAGRYGGCGCHFRHIPDHPQVDRSFHEPVDWAPEDPEEVEDTGAMYDLFCRLVSEGAQVDVIDLWNDEVRPGIETLDVRLSEIGREKFLFMENRRF